MDVVNCGITRIKKMAKITPNTSKVIDAEKIRKDRGCVFERSIKFKIQLWSGAERKAIKKAMINGINNIMPRPIALITTSKFIKSESKVIKTTPLITHTRVLVFSISLRFMSYLAMTTLINPAINHNIDNSKYWNGKD